MNISEEIKGINNKIKQNKAQYNLDRQTAKIYASSTGNISKYEILTSKSVLPEKYFLEKAAALKRFEYSSLVSEFKKQTSVAEKHYQGLSKLFESDKNEEPVTIKKKTAITSESKLMHGKFSLRDYSNIRNYYNLSFTTKYDKLLSFYHRLNEFRNLVP